MTITKLYQQMKTKLFLLFFFITMSTQAQVTIGSNLIPNPGSILDLKEKATTGQEANSSKGLLLPRVKLNTAPDLAPAVVGASDAEKKNHVGLAVYHIGNINLCAGIYIWDETRWNRLPTDCNVKVKCETVLVNGNYRKSEPLNMSNTITFDIDVPPASAGGTYQISTDTQNGMSFSATGTLVAGTMHILLDGTGAPVTGYKTSTFTIRSTFSNSTASNTCTATITPDMFAIRKIHVTTVGSSSLYGWHAENSGSYAMYNSDNNFGEKANSVVKMDPFTVTSFALNPLYESQIVTPTGGINDANIFICGYYSYIVETNTNSAAVTTALVNKLKNGGVLILTDEYQGNNNITLNVLKRLFPAYASGMQAQGSNAAGFSYTISSSIPANDPILDGPFSVTDWTTKTPLNLRGKLWGNDFTQAVEISGLPMSEVIVYSTGLNGNPTMFRLKNYNLFFVGDGGFVSNHNTYIGNNYLGGTACPFAIDTDYHPIPKINFGIGNQTVYNSQIFANVMAWAVKQASK